MSNLATTLETARRHHQEGDIPRAEHLYRQVQRADPYNPEAAFLLASAYKDQGKLGDAMAYLQKALAIRPNYGEALNARGLIFAAKGDMNEARESLRQALRAKPDYAEAHNNLGVTFVREQRLDEAIPSFIQAVRFKPEYADALLNLARAFESQGKAAEAITAYRKLLPLRPNDAGSHNALGLLLAQQGKQGEAAEEFRQAIKLEPNHASYHNNLGVALTELGRPADSLGSFEAAVRLQPDHAEAHKSLAMTWLHLGDFERGWAEYEWRWKCKDFKPRSFRQPAWDGSPLGGRRILLYSEQGIGDTFQFIRYAPLVAELGALVTLECPESLVPILRTCPGIAQVVGHGAPLPDFECHAALMSLPWLFRTTLATVPAPIPYLSAEPDLIERWRRELSPLGTFKVGIVWQGNPKNGADCRRSIPLESFAALASVPGVQLFSIQKAHGTEQLAKVIGDFPITDLGGRLDLYAFRVTAAAMCNLELIISCDTASAHLAGALGRPVWVPVSFASEWRWLVDREDSPWYPSMRIFRQPKLGDWTGVFERMADALRRLVSEKKPVASA